MPLDWQPLIELVNSRDRFVLTSHVRPDADAIGSEMGMARLLRSLGKQVRIINPSATPDHIAFLDPEREILKFPGGVTLESACETDAHLILDTSAWQQINDVRKILEATPAAKVVIDHHLSSDDLGALELKDESASATGVLIAEFADAFGLTPDRECATALFAAVSTDTGWFRYSNADARTYRVAARLIDLGAEPHRLHRELYERSTLARLKLHAVALSRVTLAVQARLAFTYVLRSDFAETGAHPSDTEELVNRCLTIVGVQAAFILVEQIDGRIKVSFRSRSDMDVADIAEQFGGGGHMKASGAMLAGPLEAARSAVLDEFQSRFPVPEDVPEKLDAPDQVF